MDNKDRAAFLLKELLEGAGVAEEREAEIIAELDRIVPDPNYQRLLYYGPWEPMADAYDKMTIEAKVEEMFAYTAILL